MATKYVDPVWIEHGYGTRFQGFQNLMRLRIRDVLLVSSLYDLYLFEEDGRLYELLRNEYRGLHLSNAPELTRVSTGEEAISLAKHERRFDLILTTLHVEDMTALTLARRARESDIEIPIVLLTYDNRELKDLIAHHDTSVFDGIFVWQGDFRLLIGIIKHLEDKFNVEHDMRLVGVQSIILIEDNVSFYSSFLPIIYTELLKQSQRLISEGINLSHKYLRMRARPKIILCKTYEEAWAFFEKHQENILGVISDVDFVKDGRPNPRAGVMFARNVRAKQPDIPILLQSTSPEHAATAKAIGTSFVLKNSQRLLHELQQFMTNAFSFGDFVFRLPDGKEVGRAANLRGLENEVWRVPIESLVYHAERNHFSNWLKARTEFELAHRLRPRKVSDFDDPDTLRDYLGTTLREYRIWRQRGLITDFSKQTFDPESSFARIGGGSLGGKARGLGFVNMLINSYELREKFAGVRIDVPPAVVLGTDVFDQFLEENDLQGFALATQDDVEVVQRFLAAPRFPDHARAALVDFLEVIRTPLAVRSSSLLEDSLYHPFAGVYETFMIPNMDPDTGRRLENLIAAIKRVYASTFTRSAKDYIGVTSYRLEEEKMAVIVQKMVGARRGNRFYPVVSGVAKSHNFYPLGPQKAGDGIAAVALGLGRNIVEGGACLRFSPRYPRHVVQFFSTQEALRSSQKGFFAVDLESKPSGIEHGGEDVVKWYSLKDAELDYTLHYVGSTYSPQDDAIYDGVSRPGVRLVSFAPILRHKVFPLPEILELLLDMGSWGMGNAVEIEFAVELTAPLSKPKPFGILQMRPLVLSRETGALSFDNIDPGHLLCDSVQVMGHGVADDVFDIITVDIERFDRGRTREVAAEVAQFNEQLNQERRPYVLIGVGRWGSLDPWLGIPVKWDQISGARAIVEADFKDMDVEPSQGSHFFQNITSFMVMYLTVNAKKQQGFIDWTWLEQQPAHRHGTHVRHLRFDTPIVIKCNGHQSRGVIFKPEPYRDNQQ